MYFRYDVTYNIDIVQSFVTSASSLVERNSFRIQRQTLYYSTLGQMGRFLPRVLGKTQIT